MAEKKITCTEIGEGLYAFTAEGDPNSGVIIGDDSVRAVEAQATPRLAPKVIDCIREVTDKPITRYHAMRVLGASAFNAPHILMSEAAHTMVVERGHEGTSVLILDDQESEGSRAICFAKRTLETCDHRGAVDALLGKGVVWNIRKVFHDDAQLHGFDLLPETGPNSPPSSNCRNPFF